MLITLPKVYAQIYASSLKYASLRRNSAKTQNLWNLYALSKKSLLILI